MLDVIMRWLEQKFIGTPRFIEEGKPLSSLPDYSNPSFLDLMIRCESTHFLFSCLSGWLVFCAIWTILSLNKQKWYGPYIFRISFVFGLLASVTCHFCIDAFTELA